MATQLDIIKLLADKKDITQAEARGIIETIYAEVVRGLKRGDTVKTPIGVFYVGFLEGRNGTNPRTQEPIYIQPKNKVKFKPFQNLMDAVN